MATGWSNRVPLQRTVDTTTSPTDPCRRGRAERYLDDRVAGRQPMQPLSLSAEQRELIVRAADGLPPVERQRFLNSVADTLMFRDGLLNSDVLTAISQSKRAMFGEHALARPRR